MNFSKLFFVLCSVVCLALRVFLIFNNNINPATGFFAGGDFAVSFYNTFLFMCMGIIILYGLFKSNPTHFKVKNPIIFGLSSTLCGIVILAVTAREFLGVTQTIFSYVNPEIYIQDNVLHIIYEISKLFLGIASGATFISFSISNNTLFRHSGLLLCPSIWTFLYSLQQFKSYPQIADMSDRVLWFLTIVFFCLNMIGEARIFRTINTKKGMKYVNAYGYSCALCGFVLLFGQLFTLNRVATLDITQYFLAGAMALQAFVSAQSISSEEGIFINKN